MSLLSAAEIVVPPDGFVESLQALSPMTRLAARVEAVVAHRVRRIGRNSFQGQVTLAFGKLGRLTAAAARR
jgi:hypothetical protein